MSWPWIILIVSGMLEAVWATSLAASNGFKKLVPSIVFIISLVLSLLGLSWAMGSIPTGTAYAVWVGIGAVLTAGWAVVSGAERMTAARALLLLALIGCVVGLKVVS
ncbi:DMT family transporter [Leucobacter sp. M11]|uniref:DMT family transporter n=1 Tax=Leucobacter sp. M11 TaxID=2993565 RepID=UPI002D8010FA|nr:SMR family transporter [Leucobacter sp. M11]MEB4613431.1 SMR family transporter [Leucobacter sp. M11]